MRALLALAATLAALAALAGTPARAIDQWASNVIGYSSQYSSVSWSAAQVIGPPNTFTYGDLATAWTAAEKNGTREYVTMGFDTPVHATGVTVRETDGNGFVVQVDVVDTNDVLHTVWTGTDNSQPGAPADFLVSWPATSYLVKGVKITVNTDHDLAAWEEIDAVQLHDPSVPTGPVGPQWASSVIDYTSAYHTDGSYSPAEALLAPDVFAYADDGNAWTAATKNGTRERLTLGFPTPVHSYGATIRETLGNGFVYQIDALDTNNVLHTVWTGADTSQPGQPAEFHAYWTPTTYLTKGLRVYVNTDHDLNAWEEIDAVQLLDAAAGFTVWASGVVGFSSQYSDLGNSAAKALDEPTTIIYGDDGDAWAPSEKNGTVEYLTLGYDTPMLADGAIIRENSGNGFVTKIEALDLNGAYHTVWQGTDPTPPDAARDFKPTWTRTTYPVRGLKVTVNTDHNLDDWEEIDAAGIVGVPAVNGAPSIGSLAPNPALKGGPVFALVVNGAGFTNGSAVLWNGTALPTNFVSTTLVTALVPAANVSVSGPATIMVTNPAPGGGGSGPATLTVSSTLWGDVDGNGTRNGADAIAALRIAAGISKATALNGGDVAPAYPASTIGYGDRRIDVLDALRIVRALNGV